LREAKLKLIKILTPASLKQQSNKENSTLCVFNSLREPKLSIPTFLLNPPRLCCFVALREVKLKLIKIFTPASLKQQSNKENSTLCVLNSLREPKFSIPTFLLNPPRLCCVVALREAKLKLIKILTPASLKQQSNKENSTLCVLNSLREPKFSTPTFLLNPPRLCCFVALREAKLKLIKILTPASLKQQRNKENSTLCVLNSLREPKFSIPTFLLNPPRLCCFVALREVKLKLIKILTPASLKQQSNKENSTLCVLNSLREPKHSIPTFLLNPPRLCCIVALREPIFNLFKIPTPASLKQQSNKENSTLCILNSLREPKFSTPTFLLNPPRLCCFVALREKN
jgi:hypothetical protein